MGAQLNALLQNLKPKNTLFARIFIWFWCAVIAMVVSAFVVARLVGNTWELSAPPMNKLEKAQELSASVQSQLIRRPDMERALRRVGGRARWHLMTIDPLKRQMVLGFPRPLLTQAERFNTILDAQTPLLIRTNNMEFIGPLEVQLNNKPHMLFVGQVLPRGQRPLFVIGAAFLMFVVLGTIACIAIAMTIVKPIKRLSELSRQFASGHEQAPDQGLLARQDELGQLHNDFYQMATKLAKSVVQQKALMANVSHELRTPLTRMQLAVAMLDPKDEHAQMYSQRIEKEISVMDALIGQALQLAKLDNQNQNSLSQKQLCALSSILQPVLDDLAFEAQANDREFTCQAIVQAELMLNSASFVSAIENVTRNAIKFSHKQVKLSTLVQTIDAKPFVVISIEDDGDGLTSEQSEQIFEPFYRITSNSQHQGTGLGLAIVKAAVDLHNGQIKVYESSLGGLNISLSFPIEQT